jgi:DNA-binding transcriptional MerR regulator
MASAAPAPEPIPVEEPKLFRIGEVSRLTDLKTFVLRYWETEFPTLQPVKSPSGHRLYRREDIETVFEIKRLLYDEGFTIVGARKHLGDRGTIPARNGDVFNAPAGRGLPANGHGNDRKASALSIANGETHEPRAASVAAAPNRSPTQAQKQLLTELRDELRAALTLLEDE